MKAPPSISLHAASLLGDIGRTTVNGTDARTGKTFMVGESIYGPFEAGLNSAQDHILRQVGCIPASRGYVDAGIDATITEQMVAFQCDITLPRLEDGKYVSLLDECGGHTEEYHFHERLSCLYDGTSGGHSTQLGRVADGKFLYGKWEDTSVRQLPQLDACGGHYGLTPESPSLLVYHYHVQDRPPFTVGCYGPNDDGSLVTVAQCRTFYPGCDGNSKTITTATGRQPYEKWCPCFDAYGSNTGVNFAQLAVFTTTTTTIAGERGWSLFRVLPMKSRGDQIRGGTPAVHIAEVAFRFRGAAVSLKQASAYVARGGPSPQNHEPARAIDGLSQTKWVDFSMRPLNIKLPQATPIDSYTLITAQDTLAWDPIQWRLEGSNDGGISWDVLHEVLSDYKTPTDRSQMLEWFDFPRCLEVIAMDGGQTCLNVDLLQKTGYAFPSTPPSLIPEWES